MPGDSGTSNFGVVQPDEVVDPMPVIAARIQQLLRTKGFFATGDHSAEILQFLRDEA